jgi:WXG100 family type VII secretion target
MDFFQVIFSKVNEVASTVAKQQQQTTQVMDTIQGFVPKIQAAWIGGDADEFAADVQRKVIPAIMEVIAAIAGINLNLTKASDVVNKADSQSKSLVDGLEQEFAKI